LQSRTSKLHAVQPPGAALANSFVVGSAIQVSPFAAASHHMLRPEQA